MSYASQALLSADGHFRSRVASCYAVEQPTSAVHPTVWADQNQWQLAAAPGFADAYQYALDTGVVDPGNDPAVITDQQILAAVQARLAGVLAEAPPLLAVVEGDAGDNWITVQDSATGLGYRLIAVPAT